MENSMAAKVPLVDLICDATRIMKRGASMRLSGIPDDKTFLSNNYGPLVTAAIAERLMPSDGRPMNTDVFIGKLLNAKDLDRYDVYQAMKHWNEGDWKRATYYLEPMI